MFKYIDAYFKFFLMLVVCWPMKLIMDLNEKERMNIVTYICVAFAAIFLAFVAMYIANNGLIQYRSEVYCTGYQDGSEVNDQCYAIFDEDKCFCVEVK